MNERIKAIREFYKLNMRDFAEKLGVTHSAISLLESGKRSITPQMVKLICKEFNVNEEWLLDGTGEMLSTIDRDIEIATITARMAKPSTEADQEKASLTRVINRATDEEIHILYEIAKKWLEELNKGQDS